MSGFHDTRDINEVTNKFFKRLDIVIVHSFNKVKVKGSLQKSVTQSYISHLFAKRKILRGLSDDNSNIELEEVENKLAKLCAEDNVKRIKEEIDNLNSDDDEVDPGKLWKMRKKLFPSFGDLPAAIKDADGNLTTSQVEIEELLIET